MMEMIQVIEFQIKKQTVKCKSMYHNIHITLLMADHVELYECPVSALLEQLQRVVPEL